MKIIVVDKTKGNSMSEKFTETPEAIRDDYPKSTPVWRYSIDRALSFEDLKFVTEGTRLRLWTMDKDEYTLGSDAGGIYLGLRTEDEAIDIFPRATMSITRRTNENFKVIEGFDISLNLIAKPSDEYSMILDLWETDRQHIEAVVHLLGGERTI